MSTEAEFVSLAIDQVRPSSRNPRKTFDQAALDQLAASIESKGVLEPILVRPRTLWQRICGWLMVEHASVSREGDVDSFGKIFRQESFSEIGITFKSAKQWKEVAAALVADGRAEPMPDDRAEFGTTAGALAPCKGDPLGLGVDHYELVAGERRWRASALAGKDTIPALVRELSDHDAAEIRVIENDQREDVAPLEQAEGYADLIAMGDDVESIAAKIGRPAKYVTARLTLVRLVDALKDELREGKLPFGHAHLLARLPAAEQLAVLTTRGGIYDHRGMACSLSYLREIIRDYTLPLSAAPWKWADEALVPAAGSCTACPKRSGNNRTLFDDLVHDAPILSGKSGKSLADKEGKVEYCTDRTCYAAKQTAFVELQVKRIAEKNEGEAIKVSSQYYRESEGVLSADKYDTVSAKEAKRLKPGEVKEAVVVDGEEAGRVIHVKVRKNSATAKRDDGYAKQERERREKAKAENAARTAAIGLIADGTMKLTMKHTGNWQALAMAMAKVSGGEVCRWVADRRELPASKEKWDNVGRVDKHIKDLETSEECLALVAELIAGKLAQGYFLGAADGRLWAAFGIDRAKLVKDAQKALAKPAPKKPAKKRKAAKA